MVGGRPLPLACLVLALLPSLALAIPYWNGNSTVRVCAPDSPPSEWVGGLSVVLERPPAPPPCPAVLAPS